MIKLKQNQTPMLQIASYLLSGTSSRSSMSGKVFYNPLWFCHSQQTHPILQAQDGQPHNGCCSWQSPHWPGTANLRGHRHKWSFIFTIFLLPGLSSGVRTWSRNAAMWGEFCVLVRSLQENKSVVTSASSKLRTVHIMSFRAPARGRDRGRLLGIYYLL